MFIGPGKGLGSYVNTRGGGLTISLSDEYTDQNTANSFSNSISQQYTGQSINGDGGVITTVEFGLAAGANNPSGTLKAYVYAHFGPYGSGGKPIGPALATSEGVSASVLSPGVSPQWIEFTFSGANQITLVNGTKYCLVVDMTPISASDYPKIFIDTSSPTHGGNWFLGTHVPVWTGYPAIDACFKLYTGA